MNRKLNLNVAEGGFKHRAKYAFVLRLFFSFSFNRNYSAEAADLLDSGGTVSPELGKT